MKRTILSLIFSAILVSASAQDMQTLFCQMPDQYIPQLQDAWRKDLTDLFKEGKEARLKNNMNGYSTLEALNDDYLRLQSTERTRIEMRRFPLINGTYVICMVTTYFGPAPDSRVAFYSTDWKPLPSARRWRLLPARCRHDERRLAGYAGSPRHGVDGIPPQSRRADLDGSLCHA